MELTGSYEEGSWQDVYRSMGCDIPYWDDEDKSMDSDIEAIDCTKGDFEPLTTVCTETMITTDAALELDTICPEAIPIEILVLGFEMSSFGR
jgi:hypothetical protein